MECAERRESATPMTAASVEATVRNGIGLSAKPWPDAVNRSASAPPRASGTAVDHQRPTRFAVKAVTSINTKRLTVSTIVPDSPRLQGLDPRRSHRPEVALADDGAAQAHEGLVDLGQAFPAAGGRWLDGRHQQLGYVTKPEFAATPPGSRSETGS
jgi:hypothetical protein